MTKYLATLLLAAACSSSPLADADHIATTDNDVACVGLSKVDVEPGVCVRLTPKPGGPSVGYGPACDELTWLDSPGETCAAWVSQGESVWVNDASVSFERGAASCSCR